MSDLSNFSEDNLLKWLAGKTPATQPNSWNVALFFGDPTDGGSGTEVSQADYGRVSTSPSDWTVSSGTIDNDIDIDFGQATSNWDAFDTAVIIDQNGNTLFAAALDQTYNVATDESFQIDAGDLDLSLD